MKPNFGGGMPNMNNLMKQAQKMQAEMQKQQAELETREFVGVSGGGAVSATLSGKRELTSISIKPEVVDADDVEMLEDLILVAVNDALRQLDAAAQSGMGKLGGLV